MPAHHAAVVANPFVRGATVQWNLEFRKRPNMMAGTSSFGFAEYILKAAVQGHTTYHELVAAAGDQIQNIISAFT